MKDCCYPSIQFKLKCIFKSVILLLIVFTNLSLVFATNSNTTTDTEKETNSSGATGTAKNKPKGFSKKKDETNIDQRIVDAREVDPAFRAPFMAVFNFKQVDFAQCTASILSDYWAVSAAHCLGPKDKISLDDCGTSLKPKMKLECSLTESGDLKITPLDEPFPRIYVGVKNFITAVKTSSYLPIEYIIRHKFSYPGGSYGHYGGYDIILIKLKDPVSKIGPETVPIYLPADETFPDLGQAMIAGYGRFRRAPCEVGRQGPDKFEFCGVEKSCTKNSRKFNNANCSTEFQYKGKQIKGCSYEPTPSATNPVCQNFMKSENFHFKKDIDDVIILEKGSQKVLAKCFRHGPGSYGWCGTMVDYSSFPNHETKVEPDNGWGFCEKSCYPDMDVSLGGIAREKEVDVVNDEYCEATLKEGGDFQVKVKTMFKIKPLVMCVAFNHTYRSLFYESDGSSFVKVDGPPDRSVLKQLDRKENYYITGSGTCGGDSGGPLYKIQSSPITKKKEYVLIGTTSRGTGVRGNCGGLDNPTHYVRVKFFIKWMKEVIGAENLHLTGQGLPDESQERKD